MVTDEPTVVERTGLVLLSRGEIVVPDSMSEAVLASAGSDGLVLEFPVEIEVSGCRCESGWS